MKNTNTKKQYAFNFVGGGWNSVMATNKTEAKQLIIKQYGTFGLSITQPTRMILVPNLDTLRILTAKEEKELMNAFW